VLIGLVTLAVCLKHSEGVALPITPEAKLCEVTISENVKVFDLADSRYSDATGRTIVGLVAK
jgi:hypothetical protein